MVVRIPCSARKPQITERRMLSLSYPTFGTASTTRNESTISSYRHCRSSRSESRHTRQCPPCGRQHSIAYQLDSAKRASNVSGTGCAASNAAGLPSRCGQAHSLLHLIIGGMQFELEWGFVILATSLTMWFIPFAW